MRERERVMREKKRESDKKCEELKKISQKSVKTHIPPQKTLL